MKIAIEVPSNRPQFLEQFIHSLEKFPRLRDSVKVGSAIQPPFTGEEPFLNRLDRWTLIENLGRPTPLLHYRKQSMLLFPDADVFWNLDCDHEFKNLNGKVMTKGCDEFYLEIFDFFENDPMAGVVVCNGLFGGNHHGYDFTVYHSSKNLGNGRGGSLIRNVGVDNIVSDYEASLRGIDDKLIIMNVFAQGYEIYRRFNSPMGWEDYKKTRGFPRADFLKHSDDPTYSFDLNNETVFQHIREKFNDPDWRKDGWDNKSSTKLPKGLMKLHFENRIKLKQRLEK